MIIESGENTTLRNSPFKSESWLKGLNTSYTILKAISSNKEVASIALIFSKLSKTKLFQVRTLTTPRWAMDCGLNSNVSEKAYKELFKEISNLKAGIKVIDLPSSIDKAFIDLNTPKEFQIQWRHTRQLSLLSELPSNRRKQLRRADREGIIAASDQSAAKAVICLHEESRLRKSLNHDNIAFENLINSLANTEDFFIVTVKNNSDELMASGGFLIIDNHTCLYAFGGQKRSKQSGIATVALIDYAMQIAKSRGCDTFDFGGSADPGVDKFYKEFGAEKVSKARLVQVKPILKPVMKLMRPDLF